MSYAARLSPRTTRLLNSAPVVLVKNLRDMSGRAVWHFVQVASAKYVAFQRQARQGNIDFAAFGKVLASGFGATPPAHVTERMTRVYGFKG